MPFIDDLSGLKVSHDLDELVEGEEQILTLKDSRILDNEGTPPFRSTAPIRYLFILYQRMNYRTFSPRNISVPNRGSKIKRTIGSIQVTMTKSLPMAKPG